jgi:pimeloyl-ACP methyl ester carboxylesterase
MTHHRFSPPTALLLATAVLASTVLVACSAAPAAPAASQQDLAGTVDIGSGRMIYVECRGTGSPTVVLESGLDVAGDLWDSPLGPPPHVFPTIAQRTRVCTYDRPGTTRAIAGGGNSRSDPVPQPTTTADAVADLHALLAAVDQTEPVVLVGHSYAGVVSRLYAATYPDDVSGMVLVDALAPELRAGMTAEQYAAWKTMNERTPEQIADYPDLERIEFDASLDQLDQAPPIRQMPLVVITADHPMAPDNPWIDQAHQAAQAAMAQLVQGAEHVVAHSGHNVMIDDAPAVIAAIDDVIEAVRDGRSTAVARPAGQRDELTPLITTALGPDPVPFLGTDGRYHLAYELSVLNASPRPATITELQILGDDDSALATLDRAQVAARAVLVGDYPTVPAPVTDVPPGRTVVLALENIYPDESSVPAALAHRVSASFGAVPAGQAGTADKYPDRVSETGGLVTVGSAIAVVIGPPVTGAGWSVSNGCCALNAHRDVILPVAGRLNAAERFAIDWVKFDLARRPLAADGVEFTFVGDPARNESYLAFGEPTIAVADATVVAAVREEPDARPRTIVPGIPFDRLIGNHVILDLGNGVFALYAHLEHNSVNVQVGDRVAKGQQIGRVGNSGNTTEAHLHFQLMNSPLPLSADQVTWVIDDLMVGGTVTVAGVVDEPAAGPRTAAFPLADTICDFAV